MGEHTHSQISGKWCYCLFVYHGRMEKAPGQVTEWCVRSLPSPSKKSVWPLTSSLQFLNRFHTNGGSPQMSLARWIKLPQHVNLALAIGLVFHTASMLQRHPPDPFHRLLLHTDCCLQPQSLTSSKSTMKTESRLTIKQPLLKGPLFWGIKVLIALSVLVH